MKWNLLITVVIIHTLLKVSSQDNVLNSTMLKQYVFVNAPKEWFKYVIKYLQVKISKRHLNLKEIIIFLRSKTSTIDVKTIKFESYGNKEREKTTKHPVGLVTSYRERSISGKFYLYNNIEEDIEEDKIIFMLDKKLRLNLTLHHIPFEFRHLRTCSVGEVRVVSHSKNEQVFRYCGIHSNMITYPQNTHVSIFLTRVYWYEDKMTGIHNVTAFYSVIDTKMIVSLQRYRPLSRNFVVWNLNLVPKDIRVMKFALRTKKYQHFIIKFTNELKLVVELYDGPRTYSSNIFKNNYEIHVTSTFQSIIYLWTPSTKR